MHDASPHILFVEDDEIDREGLTRALRGTPFTYAFAEDGAAALAMLHDDTQPTPSLIVLDLKMPQVDGFDLLRALHEDAACRTVPRFVFSSSQDRVEVARAYTLGATGYVAKQIGASSYKKLIHLLDTYLSIVVLATPA